MRVIRSIASSASALLPRLGVVGVVGIVGLGASLATTGALSGCSGKTLGRFDNQNDGGGSITGDDDDTGGGSITGDGDGAAPTPAQDGCSEAAKLVYVVSRQNDLYSFAPDKLKFDYIGTLDCSAGSGTPNSMAVDRSGTAWVNYSDGRLFKVSTKDASCTSTKFKAGQHGFGRFGMAFATDKAGATDETLYVVGIENNNRGKGLAKIDLGTMLLEPIGDFSDRLEGYGAELTGTANAELYGFFTTLPNATLAAIDTGSGGTSKDVDLEGVSTGMAWAFSFWGGDFWFYTSPDGSRPSSVTQLHASTDGSIEVVKERVGDFTIVGAGVSTCAPTTMPR